jgi:hypothetical protein
VKSKNGRTRGSVKMKRKNGRRRESVNRKKNKSGRIRGTEEVSK